MLPALALAIVAPKSTPPIFAPATPWAMGMAAAPRIPLAGDVDGDGLADIICVYPPGDSIIDVSLNIGGWKAGRPFQANNHWGKDCQAAVACDSDGDKKADVVGLFDGQTLRLAHGFKDGHFQDDPAWVKLPKKLEKPALGLLKDRKQIFAFSKSTGDGFSIDISTRKLEYMKVPQGTVWAGSGDYQTHWTGSLGTVEFVPGYPTVIQSAKGQILVLGEPILKIAKTSNTSIPAVYGNILATDERVISYDPESKVVEVPLGSVLPSATSVRQFADMDGDGDEDIIEFRYGSEKHTANDIQVYRQIRSWEEDSDHDSLTNEEERALGTDPNNPDTDQDGLLDGWESGKFRDLDLKSMGCDPKHTDLICLLSRFDTVNEDLAKSEIQRAVDYYANLKIGNPDGKTGWNLHPIWLNVLNAEQQKQPWWVGRDTFLPSKWRGLVHWMQLSPFGGGQADDLGDGGGCGGGKNSMFATFVHEFGHQIGMDHSGFWAASQCPVYPSLMNYAYSYSFEDSPAKIGYSYGELANYVLNENDLDETIPLPYDKVKFLEKGPYRFRLKANGATTLIDWNWNGVFGEKHVKADINYAYSTSAGARDTVDKTMAAPWFITTGRDAYLLTAKHDKPAEKDKSPDVSPEKPGTLYLRKLIAPTKWREPWVIEKEAVIGDPVGISLGREMAFLYQTKEGVALRTGKFVGDKLEVGDRLVLDPNPKVVPTVGTFRKTAYAFLWDPDTKAVKYLILNPRPSTLNPVKDLGVTSTIPVGMCEDTVKHEMVLGLAQDQGEKKDRWQIRRFKQENDTLKESGPVEWVQGEKGTAAGNARCTPLFDATKDAGKDGRVLFFALGTRPTANPWQCGYVAMQVADKTVSGGWLVKRYYDEWSQSRSSLGVAWFKGEILYAYRWIDGGQGPTDNNLHVGYRGSGIDPQPMGDHDDVTYMKTFGISHSILWLNKQ